ncbi:hypothetical protein [Streptomyces pseudogriseolus]|uniref:hypothetical protein n=1 Tax=Streptomyces pseudogriseolus TaxID=36817 RepID=UPI003FA2BEC6
MSPIPQTGTVGDARAFVETYAAAATAADHAPYLALFDDNAVVRDEGRTHRGRTEVRRWRDQVPPVEYDVREVTGTAAACRAVPVSDLLPHAYVWADHQLDTPSQS